MYLSTGHLKPTATCASMSLEFVSGAIDLAAKSAGIIPGSPCREVEAPSIDKAIVESEEAMDSAPAAPELEPDLLDQEPSEVRTNTLPRSAFTFGCTINHILVCSHFTLFICRNPCRTVSLHHLQGAGTPSWLLPVLLPYWISLYRAPQRSLYLLENHKLKSATLLLSSPSTRTMVWPVGLNRSIRGSQWYHFILLISTRSLLLTFRSLSQVMDHCSHLLSSMGVIDPSSFPLLVTAGCRPPHTTLSGTPVTLLIQVLAACSVSIKHISIPC